MPTIEFQDVRLNRRTVLVGGTAGRHSVNKRDSRRSRKVGWTAPHGKSIGSLRDGSRRTAVVAVLIAVANTVVQHLASIQPITNSSCETK
jgi:hypothetical protein